VHGILKTYPYEELEHFLRHFIDEREHVGSMTKNPRAGDKTFTKPATDHRNFEIRCQKLVTSPTRHATWTVTSWRGGSGWLLDSMQVSRVKSVCCGG